MKKLALLVAVMSCVGTILADGVGKVVSATGNPTQIAVPGAKKVWVRNAGSAVVWVSYNSTTNALKTAILAGTAIPVVSGQDIVLGDGVTPSFNTVEVACLTNLTATAYVGSWK
jgi:hypothetical protein